MKQSRFSAKRWLAAGMMLAFASMAAAQATAAPSVAQAGTAVEHGAPGAQVGGQVGVAVPGHVPGWAMSQADIGPSADAPMRNLTVVLARPAAKAAAFDKLLAGQHEAGAANYHHWLSPQQIGEQFGPALEDVEAVTHWLASQGLEVAKVSPDRTRITFNGSSTAIARAFGTEFHQYKVRAQRGSEVRFSVNSEPRLPAALAVKVAAISGLATEPLVSDDNPVDTILGTNHHVMTPTTFAVQYNLTPVYNTLNFTGASVKVAVIGLSRVLAQDITDFQTLMGLNAAAQPNTIIPPLGSDPGTNGNQSEQTLDVNRVMSTAPGAFVDLVVSGGSNALMTAASYNVDTLLDPVMSMSYGGCEQVQGQAVVNSWGSLFQTAAAEGITVLVSSGDSGAECGNAWDNMNPNAGKPYIPAGATAGINYLCSSSYVTCVGGTSLNDLASPSTYWTDSGATFSTLNSYVPEGTFDEPRDSAGYFQVAGSNGGVSLYTPKPAYQSFPYYPGAFTGPDTNRDVPDIALTSSGHDGYFQCLNLNCERGHFSTEEGTSAAAPGMAGIMALIVQKYGKQGSFNGTLYGIAAEGAYNTIYHDITPASSGINPCDAATPSICNNSEPGPTSLTSGGVTGFAVAFGYDEVTGIGSINVGQFFNLNADNNNNRSGAGAFNNPAGNTYPYVSTITTYPAQASVPYGTSLASSLNAATAASSTDVTAEGSNFYTATTAGGGEVPVTTSTVLSPGTYTLRDYFQPIAAYAGTLNVSSATTSLTVNALTSTLTGPATQPVSVAQGSAGTITIQVTGQAVGQNSPAPSGTISYTIGTGATLTAAIVNGAATIPVPSTLSPNTYTVAVSYSGDTFHSAATTINISLTVVSTGDATTTTVVASPTPIGIGQATSVTATVKDTTNAGTVPTGSVTFTDHSVVLNTTVPLNGGAAVNLVNGVAMLSGVTLSTPGLHLIIATYGAVAGSFQGSVGSADVDVETAASFTITVPSTAIAGTSFPLTVTAFNPDGTVATGYTGTVSFASMDRAATLPAASGLTAGVGTFTATLATLGSQTITVTDPHAGSARVGVTRLGGGPTPLYAVAGGVSATSSTINVVANTQFSNVNLGSSATLPYYIHLAAGTTVGSISVVTQGATGLDFASGTQGTGACAAQTYSTDTVCSVAVTFSPKQVGLRLGAVTLADGSGNAVSTVYISGTGVGAVPTFLPQANQVLQFTGTSVPTGPQAAAFDASGDMLVSDLSSKSVFKVNAATGAAQVFASGTFTQPAGIAIDGLGNVYVADDNSSTVQEFSPAGKLLTTISGIALAYEVHVDGAGNLYVSEPYSGKVLKITPAGAQTTVASGFQSAWGFAVDPATGNLYVADRTAGTLSLVPAAGGAPTVLATGLASPIHVVLDAAGNAYIAESFAGDVKVLAPGASTTTTLASGFSFIDSIAIDPAGNMYAVGSGQVTEFPQATPPTLTFPTTTVGQTSAPQSVALGNIGNAPLVQSTGGGITGDFGLAVGSGTPPDCSGMSSLAVNASCNLSVTFTPTTGGARTGALTLADNAANSPQAIQLSGTGFSVATTTTLAQTSPAMGNPTFGQSVTVTATVALQAGTGTPTGSIVFTVDGSAQPSVPLNSGRASIALPSLAAGAHSITAAYTPTGAFLASTAATPLLVTVSQAMPSVALSSSSLTVLAQTPVTFTATVGSSLSTPTGTVSFMDGTTLLGSGTLANGATNFTTASLAAGAHTVTAVYSGDANFAGATSAALTETVEDFNLNISTRAGSTTSATIFPGGTATYLLVISPTGAATFPADVALSVSGLPTDATYTLAPSSIAAGSGTTDVTLTIQEPNTTAMLQRDSRFARGLLPIALGMLLLPFSRRMRRSASKLGRVTSLALLLLAGAGAMAALSGCGTNTGYFGQPQKSYTITVTGTSGALSHSTNVTLTVQ